jgi:hypothetical protein
MEERSIADFSLMMIIKDAAANICSYFFTELLIVGWAWDYSE